MASSSGSARFVEIGNTCQCIRKCVKYYAIRTHKQKRLALHPSKKRFIGKLVSAAQDQDHIVGMRHLHYAAWVDLKVAGSSAPGHGSDLKGVTFKWTKGYFWRNGDLKWRFIDRAFVGKALSLVGQCEEELGYMELKHVSRVAEVILHPMRDFLNHDLMLAAVSHSFGALRPAVNCVPIKFSVVI